MTGTTPELDKAFDEEYAKYRDLFPKEYSGESLVRMQDRNETLEEVAKEFDKMPLEIRPQALQSL